MALQLRIQHYHCCGSDSIRGLGTSTCSGHGGKKKKTQQLIRSLCFMLTSLLQHHTIKGIKSELLLVLKILGDTVSD